MELTYPERISNGVNSQKKRRYYSKISSVSSLYLIRDNLCELVLSMTKDLCPRNIFLLPRKMNSNNDTLPEGKAIRARGRWGKYLGILIIAISITALIATPREMRWLILLEGILGIIGIVAFIYARIQFWRAVNKYRQQ